MQFHFFLHPFRFSNQQFYTAKQYIHVTQEGTEESFFVIAEAHIPAVSTGGISALEVGGNNFTDGAESNSTPNLLSVHTSNLRPDDMAELLRQGIAIDDDNNPAPDNVPR